MTRTRPWVSWLVVVVVVVAALGYTQSAAGQHLLARAGLKSVKNRYVALSFTNFDALPYSAVTGSSLKFSVTIDNQRGEPVLYNLVASGVGTTKARGRGAVIIPDGSKRVVEVDITVTCAPPKSIGPESNPTARVVVTLSPSNESISHTMYCRAEP